MIRRLITDRDVLAGAVSSPIVLDEHTLLTPAARDRAVQKGLVIVERGAVPMQDVRSAGATLAPPARAATSSGSIASPATCTSCGGAGCQGCDCATRGTACGCASATHAGPAQPTFDTLPDGLHLVRVEGGRVVSALPAAGAGLMQPARGGSRP